MALLKLDLFPSQFKSQGTTGEAGEDAARMKVHCYTITKVQGTGFRPRPAVNHADKHRALPAVMNRKRIIERLRGFLSPAAAAAADQGLTLVHFPA
jgi:hypothetical protein